MFEKFKKGFEYTSCIDFSIESLGKFLGMVLTLCAVILGISFIMFLIGGCINAIKFLGTLI